MMANDLKTLANIFNNRLFRVPDYQRGYAWGERQLQDFWDDILRVPDGRSHYTGQLTIEKVPQERWQNWEEDLWLIKDVNYEPVFVVDGQQRLTTAVIMIQCLVELVSDDGRLAQMTKTQVTEKYLLQKSDPSRSYMFGYEKDNPSYEFFKTQILDEPSVQNQGTKTLYTCNLAFAKKFFKDRLQPLSPAGREDVFKRLTQRLRFNEYLVDDDLDVFVAFETMNNRGKPLSRLELLKNRLIYVSTLVEGTDDQRKTLRRNITDAWKTIYEHLGKEPGAALGDDDFLWAHWIIYFSYARDEADQYAAFLLSKYFTAERAAKKQLTATDINKYVASIQEASKAWHAIHFPAKAVHLSDVVRSQLSSLARVGLGAFAPLIMAALCRKVSDTEIVGILWEAERFVFLISRLCRCKANTGDSEFYRLAGSLYRGERTTADVTSTINGWTQRHFGVERVTVELRDLFKDGGNGFYAWPGRAHFLYEYEQHLKVQSRQTTAKIDWAEFIKARKDQATIEHIYPQTPKACDWPEFEALPSDELRHFARHSLGNLLALSRPKNRALWNYAFAVKKRSADGTTGFFNGSYSEIAVAQAETWTPVTVLRRGLLMLEFLETRWQVSLGDLASKKRLLHLEGLDQVQIGGAP